MLRLTFGCHLVATRRLHELHVREAPGRKSSLLEGAELPGAGLVVCRHRGHRLFSFNELLSKQVLVHGSLAATATIFVITVGDHRTERLAAIIPVTLDSEA